MHATHAAFYYPDLPTSLLEHILVDNWGAYASNFSSAITPCDRYVTQTGTPALTSGRTTAAQWMRVMFHDFITANVSAGTGGVDASIGFETAREENKGSAFNDSFTFWRPFVNGAVSMADLIALGTVMSNNLCGGAQMPYRAGRIDAPTAGLTTGVPAPETNLEETLTFFSRAGFNTPDAIGLTACGHTMGSVHHGGFPEVVDDTFVTPNNTNGGSNFDTSRGVFDPKVVGEYVHWTGNKGGPLVTSHNDTMNSDLRLYESDKNATMRALLAQGDGFLDTCVELMGRAIDTVPSGVQLSQTITPMSVKPVNVTYDFGTDGKLILSGKVRVLTAAGQGSPSSLSLRMGDDDADTQLTAEAETGQSVFGRGSSGYGVTTYFPFSLSKSSIKKVTSFSVSGAGVQQKFPIGSPSFVVPSLTALEGKSVNVTVAVPASDLCDELTVRIAAPFPQPGTLAPKVDEKIVSVSQAIKKSDGYKLCVGTELLDKLPTGLLVVRALKGQTIVDTLLVDGGMAGW
ncbi:WSC domain-containing [Pyrenophora seminiperda CCB06]|uniref:Peroxidase n=1 Tax=Pyrenophora seminiperda CCB06 TaxID=1302712 RepID=A0A3M7M0Q6_9PLEO|nr:WSC domain-containing [Pyrenophora seminiperda CCB06]